MRFGAFGRLFEVDAPETVRCTACDGRAERLSSTRQAEGVAYHNYRCQSDGCPAGGTIVEHESDDERRVGPVFRAPRSHQPRRRDDHPAGTSVPADHERGEIAVGGST